MTIERVGDEVHVYGAEGKALRYLESLPSWRKTDIGKRRAWSERKPAGYWRCSLTALQTLKGLS